MEKLNLCEILKGHEGEIFYSPLCGEVKLISISYNIEYPIKIESLHGGKPRITLTSNGCYYSEVNEEIMLFPSKDQRDWIKWDKENNKSKVPKTWSELEKQDINNLYALCKSINNKAYFVEKSALALLKILRLIEISYGGNISSEEWYDDLTPKFIITEKQANGTFTTCCARIQTHRTPIAFHTSSQAEEFLSYEENIQLLKDYVMI